MVAPMDPTCVLNLRMIPYMDGATQKIRDFSGYGNNASIGGYAGTDVEYVDDYINQAVEHTGAKNLNLPSTVLSFSFESFTIESWIRMATVSATQWIHAKYNWLTDGYAFWIGNTGQITFWTFQGGAGQSTTSAVGAVTPGVYNQIVVTRSGASARLYKNGIDITSAAGVHINPVLSASINSICQGGGDTSRLMRHAVWNRCLSASEIYDRFINVNRV